MQHKFQKNQKIIWDSHFGYEVGYFIGNGKMYGTLEVHLVTGLVQSPCSYFYSEIKPYSQELITELSEKYGYIKEFSE